MTWIDYDRFHRCVEEYHESGKPFTALDYVAPTPFWATYGAKEQGFDPNEKRWFRWNLQWRKNRLDRKMPFQIFFDFFQFLQNFAPFLRFEKKTTFEKIFVRLNPH